MIDKQTLLALLNSIKDPVLFADTNHIIRFMNKAAINHYDEGEKLLDQSLLDCHNEDFQKLIIEILEALYDGVEERLITDDDQHRIFMRAVRDDKARLLGYFERYEPPTGNNPVQRN